MRHIVAQQLEALMVEEMVDIASGTSEKIVDAEHLAPLRQKWLTKVRSKKSGTARH
jgi:hypothetical protein